MRRPAKYLNLKRARIRQSWNKHNLYNMLMMTGGVDVNSRRTFFQQKWAAKSMTRGYHGEHIPEKKWKRMFSRRLTSAVDMPPQYLAKHDGSEQGAGRGSGLTTNETSASNYAKPFGSRPSKLVPAHFKMRNGGHTAQTRLLEEGMRESITPVAQMVYAPLERRLDTAIFRSLFATSIREARQYVVHGAVKVNGKKMSYPAYQLNPGDMFQVDPIKVLTATAQQKKGEPNSKVKKMVEENKIKYANFEARYKLLNDRISKRDGIAAKYEVAIPLEIEGVEAEEQAAEEVVEEAAAEEPANEKAVLMGDEPATKEAAANKSADDEFLMKPSEAASEISEDSSMEMNRVKLETALIDVKYVLRSKNLKKEERLSKIASFKDRLSYTLGPETVKLEPSKLIGELVKEMRRLKILRGDEASGAGNGLVRKALEVNGYSWKYNNIWTDRAGDKGLNLEEMKRFGTILRENAENEVNDKKPYATPWEPRAWMKPWVFVPRYLEVNHKICAAVYLRHPVARKGYGEVPTPFHYFSNQLAHAWYVTKGVSKYKHKPNY